MDNRGPKIKRSRALGIALTPKAERYLARKSGPPGRTGKAGKTRGRKASDYKLQLLEKQRLRVQYNVGERQMRGYYRSASTKSGNTADRLIQLLESRVDAVVYRCGFAPTIYAARQLVSHGHVQVNGKTVNVPSYRLDENDVVSLTEKGKKIDSVSKSIGLAHPPPYLELDKTGVNARLLHLPLRDEVPVHCEVSQVIEYYSRY
jgi:small subunit ribosomal protein S4